jgi:hypothetical protein
VGWRVALVDSAGRVAGALATRAFRSVAGSVISGEAQADPTGHGTGLLTVLEPALVSSQLIVAQVFPAPGPTSAAAVAAAIDWSVAQGVDLVHLSLGLADDRPVLAEAVARASRRGCVVVAASPARGRASYPAAYPGVLAACGDARCAPGEIAWLAPGRYAGHPFRPGDATRGGASIGAAWVTRYLLGRAAPLDPAGAEAVLSAGASYRGPEHRGR